MARNAVLVPISQGTEVMIVTEYIPLPYFTCTVSSIDACMGIIQSRCAMTWNISPSNGPGLIHRPESPLHRYAKPRMEPSASARTGWVLCEADPTEVPAKPLP